MTEWEDLKERQERLSTGPRLAELDRLLGGIESDPPAADERVFSALGMLLVDAILDWDEPVLEFGIVQLQRLASLAADDDRPREAALVEGRLLALIDISHWGIQRALPLDLLSQFVEPESRSHEFLKCIADEAGQSNRAIAITLGVDGTQVSRVGRRLAQAGLARKRRVGRSNQWIITPRGVQVVTVLEQGGVMRPKREHRQLQR